MPLERGLHVAPLDAGAPAVHEAHLPQAGRGGGAHVLLDHRPDVARREGVQVQLRFDGYFVGRLMVAHTWPSPGS